MATDLSARRTAVKIKKGNGAERLAELAEMDEDSHGSDDDRFSRDNAFDDLTASYRSSEKTVFSKTKRPLLTEEQKQSLEELPEDQDEN